MTPAECRDVLERFKARFDRESRISHQPGIFLQGLDALFAAAELPLDKMRVTRCKVCEGWGITRRGACPYCGALGFNVERRRFIAEGLQ